jgi:hypothetical protein
MSILSDARSVLSQMLSEHSSASKSVKYRGQTASGFAGTVSADSRLSLMGDEGPETQMVRVDASALTRPEQGATILVDGESCTVTRCRTDPVGALLIIEYVIGKPVVEGA